MTTHFNQIALWTTQQILDAKDTKTRFAVLCYFINLAKHLLAYNNLDGVRSVVAGLQSTPVYRLERTWAVYCPLIQMVGSKEREVFEKIGGLANLNDNSHMYRKRLARCKSPRIPYLGTHLSDLTFVNECLVNDGKNPDRASHSQERKLQVIHEVNPS